MTTAARYLICFALLGVFLGADIEASPKKPGVIKIETEHVLDARITASLDPATLHVIKTLPGDLRDKAIDAINALATEVNKTIADIDERVVKIVEGAISEVECAAKKAIDHLGSEIVPGDGWSEWPSWCEKLAVLDGRGGPGALAELRIIECEVFSALKTSHSPQQISDKMSKVGEAANTAICRLNKSVSLREAIELGLDYSRYYLAWAAAGQVCESAATCIAGGHERLRKLIENANAADTEGLSVRVQEVLEHYQQKDGCGADVRCIGDHLVLFGKIEHDMDQRREAREKQADKDMTAAEDNAVDARWHVDKALEDARRVVDLKKSSEHALTAAKLSHEALDRASKALKADPRLDKRREAIVEQLEAINRDIDGAKADAKRTQDKHDRDIAERNRPNSGEGERPIQPCPPRRDMLC